MPKSLFLRQMQVSQAHAPIHQSGISVLSGTAIVALGVIVRIASVIEHLALIRELRSGTWTPARSSRKAIVLATLLAVVGVAMAVYLLIVR